MGTFEQVAKMLAEQLGIDEASIKPESDVIKDLGADSLDVVELLMTLEDELGITVEDDDAIKLSTVKDIVKLIDNTKKH